MDILSGQGSEQPDPSHPYSMMRLEQTFSRDAFQPQLDFVIQSNPLSPSGEPSLQCRALQYKTWPFATKFIFVLC